MRGVSGARMCDDPYMSTVDYALSGARKPKKGNVRIEPVRREFLEQLGVTVQLKLDTNAQKIGRSIDRKNRLVSVRFNPDTTTYTRINNYLDKLLDEIQANPGGFFKPTPAIDISPPDPRPDLIPAKDEEEKPRPEDPQPGIDLIPIEDEASPPEDTRSIVVDDQDQMDVDDEKDQDRMDVDETTRTPVESLTREQLKRAFSECIRSSATSSATFNSAIAPDAKVKMSVLEHTQGKFGPYYSIKGPDTLFMKEFLPENISSSGKRLGKRFNKATGWNYNHSAQNRTALLRFQACIDALNARYRDWVLVEDAPPLDKEYGTLGWDVPFQEPQWLRDVFPGNRTWDPRLNPEKLRNNQWRFQKCAIKNRVNEKAASYIAKQSKGTSGTVWSSLYPKTVMFSPKNSVNTELDAFLAYDDKRAAFGGWSKHARYMYKDKDTKTLYVYDPWKQKLQNSQAFRALSQYVERKFPGWSVEFVRHPPDQGPEGSCNVIALMRAILVAEYGQQGTTMPVPDAYAVLASRLVSKFR